MALSFFITVMNIEIRKKMAVLIPSRGLAFSQGMQALANNLDDILLNKGVYSKQFWTPGNLPLPDCRNDLVKQLDEDPQQFDWILWCDDDMVPPPKTLSRMVDAMEESPPEVGGVVVQSFSSILGAPPPQGFIALPCMRCFQSPSQYPRDWWFAMQGGFAFSLWRRELYGMMAKPIFTRQRGEDHEFLRKITRYTPWVRALHDIVVGHCYVQQYKVKGAQRQIKEYNGCHHIKRYEDALRNKSTRNAVRQCRVGPGLCKEEGTKESAPVA